MNINNVFKKYSQSLLVLILFFVAPLTQAAPNISVNGLFSGKAILNIDGNIRVLAVSDTSPEGVKLVRTDSGSAVIEYQGKRQTLSISSGGQVSSTFEQPVSKEVRLLADEGGHFRVRLNINGRSVDALIDTGATLIAMSSKQARQLGINTIDAPIGYARTANGVVESREVTLKNVSLGDLRRQSVMAAVVEGDSPHVVLVGNSFLSGFDIEVTSGVMVMKAKY